VGKPELNVRTPFPDLSTQFATPAPIAGSTPFPLGSAPSNQSLRPVVGATSFNWSEVPKLFTIEIRFEFVVSVIPVTVDVSCDADIYFKFPRPINVEGIPYDVV
jgi:hypothetical protein